MIYFENLAKHGGLMTITFYETYSRQSELPKDKPYCCMASHTQPFIELLYQISGEYSVVIAGIEYRLRPGDLAIINPYEPHVGYIPPGHNRVVYLCTVISLDYFAPTLPEKERHLVGEINSGKRGFVRMVKPPVSESIGKLMHEHLSGYISFDNLKLCQTSFRILCEIFSSCLDENEPNQAKNVVFARSVEEYIAGNYMRPITTAELSRLFGYSESYFCRLFKQVFLVNFKDFLVEYRLRHASKLLGENMSMADIAHAVGFNNYGYFSREFKRRYSLTPSEYAANLKENK